MRRTITIVVVTLAVAAGTLAVATAGRRGAAGSLSTGPAVGTIRMTRLYGHGPFAAYAGDAGSIGNVTPLRFPLPAGTYDVVATLSFEYRTTPGDTFVVGLSPQRPRLDVRPEDRRLSASVVWHSATVLFRSKDLTGERDRFFEPFVNVFRRTGNASISTRRMLLVVDATPLA